MLAGRKRRASPHAPWVLFGCLALGILLSGCVEPAAPRPPRTDAPPSPGAEAPPGEPTTTTPVDPPPENVTLGRYVLEWGVQTTLTFPVPAGATALHATIHANVSADGPYAMVHAVLADGPVVVVRRPGSERADEPDMRWVFETEVGTGAAGETVQGPLAGTTEAPPEGEWTFQTEGGTGRNIRFEMTVTATLPG